jgi:hypothetical protein
VEKASEMKENTRKSSIIDGVKNLRGCNEQPSNTEIMEALQRSGYLLEQRLCPIIEKCGFSVTPNEQYQDQDTGKSREIDIKALSVRELNEEFNHCLFTELLAECKNNLYPVVFFSQKESVPDWMAPAVFTGQPEVVFENATSQWKTPISSHVRFDTFHHSANPQWIARQFCRLKKDKGKWITSHDDLYSSVESLVKATIYFVEEFKKS